MVLKKINCEDLIFTNDIEDDRTNTYLNLYDYDWMDYNLTTRFKTESMGILDVKFYYFGMMLSHMEVKQTLNDTIETIIYEYPTEIFKKHLIKYLEKHISCWDSQYAFNGEEEVVNFFNEVIECGEIKESKGKIKYGEIIKWECMTQ